MDSSFVPKISIVSPSYNQADFIEDAIVSVLAQNYTNFEHIIIDGGSTDGTTDILKKYPHLIWISEKDNGQSDAINKGFDMASGDIIGWLNTDDYYLPNAFHQIVDTFKTYKVDAVYGDVNFIDKQKKHLKKGTSQSPLKWFSLFHCYIHSAAFFFDRKILEEGLKVNPKFHLCMDKDFFANILFKGFKLKYIPKTLTAFRWHENNKSINTKEVKEKSAEEGFLIFCNYSGFNFNNTKLNHKLYRNTALSLLPFRKLIKNYEKYFAAYILPVCILFANAANSWFQIVLQN
ncbi:glycosyltransferase family 2 protein [Spirosoma pulveris]